MRWLFVLLPLILSACAPTTSAGLRAMAADMDAQEAAQAAQARRAEQERQAQREAMAQDTANAIAADYQRLAITQTAQGVEIANGVATQAAQQTAIVASSTQAAEEMNLEAQRVELDLRQRQAENEIIFNRFAMWLALFIGFCLIAILTTLAMTAILTRYQRERMRYLRYTMEMKELRPGEMVIDVEEEP